MNGSIRARITLAMVLVLLPMVAGSAIEIADRHVSRRQLVMAEQRQKARFVGAFVREWLDNSRVLGATVSANPKKWPRDAAAYDHLVEVINGLRAVMLVDEAGNIDFGRREPVSGANAAAIARMASSSRRNSRSAALSVFGPDNSCHLLVFYPLIEPDGRPGQVLVTDADMPELVSNLEALSRHSRERFVLTEASGRVVLSTDPSIAVGQQVPADLAAARAAGAAAGSYQQGQRLYASTHIRDLKWVGYVTMPSWAVMSPIYRAAVRDLGIAITAIVAAVLLAGVLAAGLARPIQDLEAMAIDMENGEFSQPAPATDIVELRNLSLVFRRMALATASLVARQSEKTQLLEEQTQQLRLTSERLVNAQEDERRRLAGDIHDWINQHLTSLFYHLQSPQMRDQPEAELICGRLDVANLELRRIMSELHPYLLQGEGLLAACRSHVADYDKRTGIRCRLLLSVDESGLDSQAQLGLFRILQEALANAEKHSEATEIVVSMYDRDEETVLTVADNGRGFPPDPQTRGLGLLSMKERAVSLGGYLQVDSDVGGGTRVTAIAPKRRHSNGESTNPAP